MALRTTIFTFSWIHRSVRQPYIACFALVRWAMQRREYTPFSSPCFLPNTPIFFNLFGFSSSFVFTFSCFTLPWYMYKTLETYYISCFSNRVLYSVCLYLAVYLPTGRLVTGLENPGKKPHPHTPLGLNSRKRALLLKIWDTLASVKAQAGTAGLGSR